MSVVWRLGSDYEVKDVWYGRTVIRSAYKLTYEVRGKCSVVPSTVFVACSTKWYEVICVPGC